MDRSYRSTLVIARVLMCAIFLLNGFGIIDQNFPAKELTEKGAPANLVPFMMLAGRAVEIVAGFALALGIYPQLAALALIVFLIPATLVAHAFWLSPGGTPEFTGQLINFSKNIAMMGGLLFIASTSTQPSLLRRRSSGSS